MQIHLFSSLVLKELMYLNTFSQEQLSKENVGAHLGEFFYPYMQHPRKGGHILPEYSYLPLRFIHSTSSTHVQRLS